MSSLHRFVLAPFAKRCDSGITMLPVQCFKSRPMVPWPLWRAMTRKEGEPLSPGRSLAALMYPK